MVSVIRSSSTGIRLAGEHLDAVPEVDERLREVPGVDALATDVGLAPIRQIGQRERRIGVEDPRPGHPVRLTSKCYRLVTTPISNQTVSSSPGSIRFGRRLKASGGALCGSMQVA